MSETLTGSAETPFVATKARPTAGVVDTFVILAAQSRLILKVVIAAGLVAVVACLGMPSQFTSKALILPPQRRASALSSLGLQVQRLAGIQDWSADNPSDVFVALLRSRTIEDALIDRFDLMRVYRKRQREDARRELERNSEILVTKEGMISISVTDRESKRAADLANAYAEELHTSLQTLLTGAASADEKFYESALHEGETRLGQADINSELAQEQTKYWAPGLQEQAFFAGANALQSGIRELEVKLGTMRVSSTADDPAMRRLESELAGLRNELSKLRNGPPGTGTEDEIAEGAAFPAAEMQHLSLSREVNLHEAEVKELGWHAEAALLDASSIAVTMRVVDAAKPAEGSAIGKKLVIVLAVIVTAFCATSLGIFLLAFCRQQQNSHWMTGLHKLRSSFIT